MIARLLALFILVALLDLAILVRLGQAMGFWLTIALVLVTGAIGALMARNQGIKVLDGIRTEMSVGQLPSARLIDGLMVLIGGALLVTPGLLTDVAGFALLLPWSRNRFRSILRRRMERMLTSRTANVFISRR